jgi:hypothetical protein
MLNISAIRIVLRVPAWGRDKRGAPLVIGAALVDRLRSFSTLFDPYASEYRNSTYDFTAPSSPASFGLLASIT